VQSNYQLITKYILLLTSTIYTNKNKTSVKNKKKTQKNKQYKIVTIYLFSNLRIKGSI
jgi:hypothetical protein